jgi:hypothetical protein
MALFKNQWRSCSTPPGAQTDVAGQILSPQENVQNFTPGAQIQVPGGILAPGSAFLGVSVLVFLTPGSTLLGNPGAYLAKYF